MIKKLFSVYTFLPLMLLLGVVECGNNNSEAALFGLVGEADVTGERPTIEPGGSNWRPIPSATMTLSADTGGFGLTTLVAGLTTVDLTSQTKEQLTEKLVGAGTDAPLISNVTYTGVGRAAGSFNGGTGIIGFEEGLVLSSGNIASITGPNISDSTSTNNVQAGDGDLQTLIPNQTFDAAVLEFDFECPGVQVISFQYVFSSEEYNEFVNTGYNDVFGFFVNGQNVALLPDGVTPVAINNVNAGKPIGVGASNPQYYINNDLSDGGGSIDTEMDGLTVVLTAVAQVHTGSNHLKLAIADAGDYVLDSNIFIKGNSLKCLPPNTPPVAVAGSDQTLKRASAQGVTVQLDGSGSSDAENNIDRYEWYENGNLIASGVQPSLLLNLGVHEITLVVTDTEGASGEDAVIITVENNPPVAQAAWSKPTGSCNQNGMLVTLDGSASQDIDGSIISYTWFEDANQLASGTGPLMDLYLQTGSHTLTLEVADNDGARAQSSLTFDIVDETPPAVTANPNPALLWPPNHKLVAIDLGLAIDDCDPNVSVSAIAVSNEPDDARGKGDGHTHGDIQVTRADGTTAVSSNSAPEVVFNPLTDKLELRAEREGRGTGRTYTITVTVADSGGNQVVLELLVQVPHQNQSACSGDDDSDHDSEVQDHDGDHDSEHHDGCYAGGHDGDHHGHAGDHDGKDHDHAGKQNGKDHDGDHDD